LTEDATRGFAVIGASIAAEASIPTLRPASKVETQRLVRSVGDALCFGSRAALRRNCLNRALIKGDAARGPRELSIGCRCMGEGRNAIDYGEPRASDDGGSREIPPSAIFLMPQLSDDSQSFDPKKGMRDGRLRYLNRRRDHMFGDSDCGQGS
jgi:hypothetical protein